MTTARARDRIAPDDFVALLAQRLLPEPGAKSPSAPDDDATDDATDDAADDGE
jgi:hypothetical protein